jgi:hypothetical protein
MSLIRRAARSNHAKSSRTPASLGQPGVHRKSFRPQIDVGVCYPAGARTCAPLSGRVRPTGSRARRPLRRSDREETMPSWLARPAWRYSRRSRCLSRRRSLPRTYPAMLRRSNSSAACREPRIAGSAFTGRPTVRSIVASTIPVTVKPVRCGAPGMTMHSASARLLKSSVCSSRRVSSAVHRRARQPRRRIIEAALYSAVELPNANHERSEPILESTLKARAAAVMRVRA